MGPGFVAFINLFTELGIGFGSEFTRPINHQKNVTDTVHGIVWIQFINLALMFLIINLNIDWITNYGFEKFQMPDFLLQGDYDDFSA